MVGAARAIFIGAENYFKTIQCLDTGQECMIDQLTAEPDPFEIASGHNSSLRRSSKRPGANSKVRKGEERHFNVSRTH